MPREEINQNPEIEHQEYNVSPHFKTISYERNRFGTTELSSSDEMIMDILIHGRKDPTLSYPTSPIEPSGGWVYTNRELWS